MAAPTHDPYETLGVSRGASDAELRIAYRRLVQLHHPDHNGGSAESTARFEEIQAAYAEIRSRHGQAPRAEPAEAERRESVDPNIEARLGDLERELGKAKAVRERAKRAARKAAAGDERPSDDELGYVTTDDSFSKLLDDGIAELSNRLRRLRGE